MSLKRLLVGSFLYVNSAFINCIVPWFMLLLATLKFGLLAALTRFFAKPKLRNFNEEEFLKTKGIDYESGFITTKHDKTKIHYKRTGIKDGPLIVLLHGFPEFWYSWHRVMDKFADKYNVVAIDLRGYGKSAKPEGVNNYHVHYLVNDVREVIEGLGYQQAAAVVGHDWGGVIAWNFATFFPDVLDNLIILNAPHMNAFDDFLSDYWWQRLTKFWYMGSFQLPWVAEFLFTRYDYFFIDQCFVDGYSSMVNKSNRLSQAELDYFKHNCANNIKYPINFYRAINPLYRGLDLKRQAEKIVKPTLVIWGIKDKVLDFRMVEYCKKYVPNCKVVRIEDASHWVALDQPEQVVKAMKEFLDEKPHY